MNSKLKRLVALALTAALAGVGLSGCSSGGGDTRTIEVDYQSDEFAGAFLGFYPREVTVKPGMTLKFHQTWTGEPHSVTFGTMIDEKIEGPLLDLLDDVAAGKVPLPEEPPESYDFEFWGGRVPSLFGEGDDLNQTAALPCYAKTEEQLPLDQKGCAKAQRVQPEFDGTYAYYSSGFIPFEGERSNSFEMKIAEDAKEGTYFYYCNVHDVPMGGKVTIKKDAKVESQAAMNRRGKKEADRIEKPLLKVYNKEKADKAKEPQPALAGSGDESTRSVEGTVLEFTPRTIEANVNDKVTWTFIGDHTVSFNVPPYTPLFVFDKGGRLEFNDDLDKPSGGWPGPPEGRFDGDEEATENIHLDAGDFDGSGGLKSSGTGFTDGDTYSVTFTKAGTYPYACLIHPGMIGKVVVK